MCGIAGIIANNTINVEQVVTRMSEALAHRGPDADGLKVWRGNQSTAFAHRRLAIIDLRPSGKQPMMTADGRFTITFNGEIYNYLELRARLEAEGARFATDTDTEVLLHLYERYGKECLQFLQGMFAFALRDDKTDTVFAARDRLGIKPFYYYEGDGAFLFASEIRALLASDLIARHIDAVSLDSFLSFGAVQEPRTIVKGVRSLPPAHYLVINGDGRVKEQARYWQLPATTEQLDRATAIDEIRARLKESLRLHLLADVPLGAFLSGGIDSGAIVGLIGKRATNQLNTFTVCFEEQEFSERDLARQVADHWQTSHTEIVLSERDLLASLPRAISDIDQPSIDGINTWVIARATKQAGITVALSGLGGDELFGGYPSFRRAAHIERYGAPIRWLGDGARYQVATVASKVAVKFMGDSLQSQKVVSAISAGGDLLSAYAGMRGLFSKATRAALLKAATSDEHYHLPAETIALLREGEPALGGDDVFNRISRYEMNLYMANMLLRDTDAMSMANALEVRVPLLDHKLVEWVYGLPGRLKTGVYAKQLLIDALGDDLLPEVVAGKKKGFQLPFERWLHTALKPFVAETLGDAAAVRRAGLNPSAVDTVVKRFAGGSRSTSWSRVWGLAVLVGWCERHGVQVAE